MGTIRSHTFRGKRWRVVRRARADQWGSCDPPTNRDKCILLDPSMGQRRLLTYAIHEGLHASCYDLGEDAVTEAATDIAAFLWRLGFRLRG